MHYTGDVVVGMNIHTEHMGIKIKKRANQFKNYATGGKQLTSRSMNLFVKPTFAHPVKAFPACKSAEKWILPRFSGILLLAFMFHVLKYICLHTKSAQPDIFTPLGRGVANPETTYNLRLSLKTMLLRLCHQYDGNVTVYLPAFIHIYL
jgi:hypothetical protein